MTAIARVMKRVKGNDGNGAGVVTPNPLTNTSLYEVEFSDGYVEELQYNIITENMISQVVIIGLLILLLQRRMGSFVAKAATYIQRRQQ